MAIDDTETAAETVDGTHEDSSASVAEESEDLLKRIKEKYQRKQERLEELKEQEKKMRAAAVFTKRRYREVTAALKKGGNMVSDAALAARKESVKLLDKAKAQARVFGLNAKIDEYLARLGSEIYDLVALNVTDVFGNPNVKKILSRINECHVEIELIQKRFESAEKNEDE